MKKTTPNHPASGTNHPAEGKTQPIKNKEEIQQSNDEHIDQDYPGFPNPPAKEKTIKNGSAGAFQGTEAVRPEDDSDEDHDDESLDRKY